MAVFKYIGQSYGIVCCEKVFAYAMIKKISKRYMKIAEDERERSTEGVNLSGDRKVGNCDRIALRRIPRKTGAEGAKRDFPPISQAKGQRYCFQNTGVIES